MFGWLVAGEHRPNRVHHVRRWQISRSGYHRFAGLAATLPRNHFPAGLQQVGAGSSMNGPINYFIRGFTHDDTIYGGTGNDRITGGWGNDILRGGAGNDTLRAYCGADKLFGDAGNDALVAGNGPDFLVGGPGPADRLFGDQGRDTCNDVGEATEFTECEFVNE